MTMLVVGSGGLLGSNVATQAAERTAVVGTYHTSNTSLGVPTRQLDIRNPDAIEAILDEVDPDAVVNCAAKTDVDGCESDSEGAQAVNADAPAVLAERCAPRGIDFVHVSTDYVFDGESTTPYSEDATANPIQEYGASKLAGERAVLHTDPDAVVVRLSFVYGIHRGTGALTGFPAWVRSRLQQEEETPLFTDQRITPTRAGQAADVLLSLLDRDESGLYHLACRSCITPYEFGDELRRRLSAPEHLLAKGSMADVDRPAPRPPNTCLDVSRLEATLGRPQPTLGEDLDAIAEAFD